MLTKAQVRAILERTDALQDGHFLLPDGRHTAQAAFPLRVLSLPEYATSLAATLGANYRSLRPQVVLVGTAAGALLGLEVARAIAARVMLADFANGRWSLGEGLALKKGERVLLCEDLLTDSTDLKGRAALVEAYGAQVASCAVLFDRSHAEWPFRWSLESLLKIDAPLHAAHACPECRAGVPLVALRSDPVAGVAG
ncbi:MAG TPA: hypothetical protein V6D47_20605 [Oscillatoriaceae cyanobacterium]